jgi:hypothetical protein
MRTHKDYRQTTRETLLALLVVALTFLNFGQSSAVFAAGGRVVVTGHTICGDQGALHGGEHFVCHACRPSAAMLPPPPAEPEAACLTATAVHYAAAAAPNDRSAGLLAFEPRGPPLTE